MTERVLSLREINRATLERQLLLAREKRSVAQAIEHLVGLQAQHPNAPYIGLWSRIQGFRRDALTHLIEERQVVRATLMRATLHLVTADDYLLFRSALQPALTRAFRGFFSKEAKRFDLGRIAEAARAYMAERPCTFTELRAFLTEVAP